MKRNHVQPLGISAGLIDNGAIIAIIDVSSASHQSCLEALATLKMPLLTSEAVLTELFHLIRSRSLSIENTWRFVRSGALTVSSVNDDDLPAIETLMKKYADYPMDFADATLVHLAARERLSLILTIDYDDFSTYRLPGRKKFTILPSRLRR
jgi:predicted nucleic acid-binding protein